VREGPNRYYVKMKTHLVARAYRGSRSKTVLIHRPEKGVQCLSRTFPYRSSLYEYVLVGRRTFHLARPLYLEVQGD
jgi:hypothetical protein